MSSYKNVINPLIDDMCEVFIKKMNLTTASSNDLRDLKNELDVVISKSIGEARIEDRDDVKEHLQNIKENYILLFNKKFNL
jgi:hypothetical protein